MTDVRPTEPSDARDKNLLEVLVITEIGCKPSDGEYGLYITNILKGCIGEDDYELCRDFVDNHMDQLALPEEGATAFIFREMGEFDGFPHWHKFYELAERLGAFKDE